MRMLLSDQIIQLKNYFFLIKILIIIYVNTRLTKGFSSEFYDEKEVVKFYTQGFFIDNEEVYELYNNGYRKGLRKVDHLGSEIDQLIESSTHFLQNMLLDNGKYIYGYFPHFDNEIGFIIY